jgi:hypothetical protein
MGGFVGLRLIDRNGKIQATINGFGKKLEFEKFIEAQLSK